MRSPHCLCLFLLQNRKPKVNRTRDIPPLISSSISVRISFHISILASGFYFILFDSHSSSDLVSNSPLLWLICGTNVTGAHNFLRHSSLAEFIAPFSLLFIRENIYIYISGSLLAVEDESGTEQDIKSENLILTPTIFLQFNLLFLPLCVCAASTSDGDLVLVRP